MKNQIFIHAGAMKHRKDGELQIGRCQQILDSIKEFIINSGIYNDVENINLNVIGDDTPVRFDVPKARIKYIGQDIYKWEFPTLDDIIEHSRNNPEDNILYIHTQGVSNPSTKLMEDRRKYLLHFNINKYKTALEYLKENDACGVELIHSPVTHFSQNFWWTKASHVNTLEDPKQMVPVFDYRHNAEFWICSRKDGKYKSLNNLYDHYLNAIDFSESKYL